MIPSVSAVVSLWFSFVHPPVALPAPAAPVMHAVAVECAAADSACVAGHDAHVLSDAIQKSDPNLCATSTTRKSCEENVRMAAGEWQPPPIVRCTWVARTDGHAAWLLDKQTGHVRQARNRGWVPGQYIGECGERPYRSHGAAPVQPATASR